MTKKLKMRNQLLSIIDYCWSLQSADVDNKQCIWFSKTMHTDQVLSYYTLETVSEKIIQMTALNHLVR